MKSVALPVPEIIGVPKKFGQSLVMPTLHFLQIYKGLLFRLALQMYLLHLKSIALPVSEITGGTQKIWAVPGYEHAPFSPKFLMGFYSDWPYKFNCQL